MASTGNETVTKSRAGCSPAGCLNPIILVPYIVYMVVLQVVFWVLTNGTLAQRVPACWANTWFWASPSCMIEIGYGQYFFSHLIYAFFALVIATVSYGFFLGIVAVLALVFTKVWRGSRSSRAGSTPDTTDASSAGQPDSADDSSSSE